MLSRTVFSHNANIPSIYFEVESVIYRNRTMYNEQLSQKEHSAAGGGGRGEGPGAGPPTPGSRCSYKLRRQAEPSWAGLL